MLSDFEQVRAVSSAMPDDAVVVKMVQDTLRDLEQTAPVDHHIVASYRGISDIKEADHPWAGYIAPGDAGLVISVRRSDSPGRRRFTIFHEVLHTYMKGFYVEERAYRCDPGDPTPGVVSDARLEALCDRGAAEMLFPRTEFLDDLTGNKVTWDLVNDLAERYDASRMATAARICTLNPAKTMLVRLAMATKPRDPFGVPKLRVQSCFGGAGWSFVPEHKSARDGGVFDRAQQGEVVDETLHLDELTRSPLGWVHVNARRVDYLDNDGEAHMEVRALITQVSRSGTHLGR